jgi:hypothetical protein
MPNEIEAANQRQIELDHFPFAVAYKLALVLAVAGSSKTGVSSLRCRLTTLGYPIHYQWFTEYVVTDHTFVPYMARASHLPGSGVELDCS